MIFGFATVGAALAFSAGPAAAALNPNGWTGNGVDLKGGRSHGQAAAPVHVDDLRLKSFVLPDCRRLGSSAK